MSSRNQRRTQNAPAFELGSTEWVSLPQLGLGALLARIDTGAKTSALHAMDIEVYQAGGKSWVRFVLAPPAGREGRARNFEAQIVARRWVTSSNGARELRCVISTEIEVGARRWPIELTLTNRARMRYPMLIGRQAILPDMIVRPRGGSRHPRPTIADENSTPAPAEAANSGGRRIGLIGIGPVGRHWQALADALSVHGHVVERIDVRACRLVQRGGVAGVEMQGRLLAPLNAVLAILEPQAAPALAQFAIAIVRQAEMGGAFALNGAAGLTLARDSLAATQALWAAGVPVVAEALRVDEGRLADRPTARLISGLVIGSEAIACRASRARAGRRTSHATLLEADDARLMVRAAQALALGFARVDLRRTAEETAAVAAIAAAVPWGERGGQPDAALVNAIASALEARLPMIKGSG